MVKLGYGWWKALPSQDEPLIISLIKGILSNYNMLNERAFHACSDGPKKLEEFHILF